MEKGSGERKFIVIVGPESTGKTTLCRELAHYYNTGWVPEYAREYVEKLERPYTYDDVILIAKEQIRAEQEALRHNNLVLFDTDLIITRVWFQEVYNQCPEWVDRAICQSTNKFYLLCHYDLPWQPDPVRENPNNREYLFKEYRHIIESNNFPYFVVTGMGAERTANARKAIDNILKL